VITLLDCQNSPGLKRIAGACPTTQDFTDLVNEAARRLMRRGDWFDTAIPIFVCVYNGCLVMPRYVQQIRKINFCNREIQVKNGWFEFLAYNQNHCGWSTWLSSWLGQQSGITQQGSSAVFQDVLGDGRTIRAYARCSQDIGKQMRIFGLDNNGQPLITMDPTSGEITQGALLTIASPFGSTSTFVRRIDYVVREQTTMIVDVYAYNSVTNLLEDIAHYEPSETTPTYSRYKLNIPWPNCGTGSIQPNCCGTQRGVVMLVKLRFIDAQQPNDLVLVPCVDALKVMVQAVLMEDANNFSAAKEREATAIEILQRETENNSPDEIFSVSLQSLGSGVRSNQVF